MDRTDRALDLGRMSQTHRVNLQTRRRFANWRLLAQSMVGCGLRRHPCLGEACEDRISAQHAGSMYEETEKPNHSKTSRRGRFGNAG